jgi:hypothetical protein
MRRTLVIVIGAGAVSLAIGLAAMGGCLRSTEFRCGMDNECVNGGVQGRCESGGNCSFPDPNCASGFRFGESFGPFSNECVGGNIPIDAGPDIDAPDAPPDAYVHDARECFGTGMYELCFAMMPPMGTVTLAGTLDTDNDIRCTTMPTDWMTAGQPDACMVIGRLINVNAALVVTGTRPLALVGEIVTISSTLDIASHRGGTTGAAANASQCAAFATAPVNDTNGAGGGAGGSFIGAGGNGGRGEAGSALGGTAAAADAVAPTVLRGGCPGQTGATGTQAAGTRGASGGALYITASVFSMTSAGVINASGAGGAGGGTYSGGSGAGTGGMIVIHAVELGPITGGRLLANGGGGASGGDNNTNGVSGSDPNIAMVTTPATGGPGGNAGANGGNGAAGTTAAQNGAGSQNNKAGGGGGGGGGYIQANVTLPGVTASPDVTVVP